MSNFGWAARAVLAASTVGLIYALPAQAQAAAMRPLECSPAHNDDGCFFADHPTHRYPQRHDGSGPASTGPHWGVIDRNTTGGASATLRTGPYESAFGNNLAPPSGIGSLNIQTPAGSKVDFGNEVDFVGQKVSRLTKVSFFIYTTKENQAEPLGVNNLPLIRIEISPSGSGTDYSTLVYVPTGATANAGKFTKFDATSSGYWWLTDAAGTSTGCTQSAATPCTLADIKAALPAATIYTVSVGKGSDDFFAGAVDDLQINNTIYDFELSGVEQHRA